MTAPMLGQGTPKDEGWIPRLLAGLQTQINELRAKSGGGHTIQDEGIALTARAGLNFVGSSVTATDNPTSLRTDVTVIDTTVNGVIVSGTPAAGQVLTATSGATASWAAGGAVDAVPDVFLLGGM